MSTERPSQLPSGIGVAALIVANLAVALLAAVQPEAPVIGAEFVGTSISVARGRGAIDKV
jgi:hypothetical protein